MSILICREKYIEDIDKEKKTRQKTDRQTRVHTDRNKDGVRQESARQGEAECFILTYFPWGNAYTQTMFDKLKLFTVLNTTGNSLKINMW